MTSAGADLRTAAGLEAATTIARYDTLTTRLAAAVARCGQITEEEALAVIARGETVGLRPGRALLASGRVNLETLEKASWWHRGVDLVDFVPSGLDPAVVEVLPLPVCTQAQAVAIGVDPDGKYVVAIADANNIEATDLVRQAMRMRRFRTVVAASASITEALRRYESRLLAGTVESSTFTAEPEAGVAAGEDSNAGKVLTAVIQYVAGVGGSDIHVECRPGKTIVKYRLDQVLHEYQRFDADLGRQLIGRIKVLAGMDVGQFLLPQGGQMQTQVRGRVVDIRVETSPSVWETEDCVLRLLDRRQGVSPLASLGVSPDAEAQINLISDRSHGLLLVTGPTGHGKTTTLYSILNRIATPDKAVRTVEDPVEYRMPEMHQVEVNPEAGRTFEVVLRSFLRFDPDIIMVGEIRDPATLKTALEASLTGHFVLATLHSNSAPSTPLRLIEMGAEPYLVAAALSGVVAQRLVRRLCDQCRIDVPCPDELGEWLQVLPDRVYDARPGGCPACNRVGYRGLTALCEVLTVDDEIERAISERASTRTIETHAKARGMQPLRAGGMAKVVSGETSFAEILRVTEA